MAIPVTILIGTMTGTAELVADEVEAVLQQAGYRVEILDMDGLDAGIFARPGLFLVCTSTYGQGDVPDNAQGLYDDLEATRPNLMQTHFGVIGLGDSTYSDTYNFGGRGFDDLLRELGAIRVGDRMEHNASSDELPEEMGVDWARNWVKALAPLPLAAA